MTGKEKGRDSFNTTKALCSQNFCQAYMSTTVLSPSVTILVVFSRIFGCPRGSQLDQLISARFDHLTDARRLMYHIWFSLYKFSVIRSKLNCLHSLYIMSLSIFFKISCTRLVILYILLK